MVRWPSDSRVRRLVALELYRTAVGTWLRRVVLASYMILPVVYITLGGLIVVNARTPMGVVFGSYLFGVAPNFFPFVVHVLSLNRPGALEAELRDVDLSTEQARFKQRVRPAQDFWYLVPLALFIAWIVRGDAVRARGLLIAFWVAFVGWALCGLAGYLDVISMPVANFVGFSGGVPYWALLLIRGRGRLADHSI